MKEMNDAIDEIIEFQEEEEIVKQELYCAVCKKKF